MFSKASVLTGILIFSASTSLAQSDDQLNAEKIVNALRANNGQATRSLTAQSNEEKGLSQEHRKTLQELSTRGLKLETIAKAGNILDANSIPSLDMEILFEFNSSKISIESSDGLEALGKALQHESLANAQILLNGHTDSKGADKHNLTLSQKRADEVRARLIKDYGISENRLIAIGFGETRLKDLSKPESILNRRVEVMNIGTQ